MNKKIISISINKTSAEIIDEVMSMLSKHLEIGEIPMWVYSHNWRQEEMFLIDIANKPIVKETYVKYMEWSQSRKSDGISNKMLEYFKQIDRYLELRANEAPPIVMVEKDGNYEIKDGGRRIIASLVRGDEKIKAYVGKIKD